MPLSPMLSTAEVVEHDFGRARRPSDLVWLFTFILTPDRLRHTAALQPTPELLEALLVVTRQKAWRGHDGSEDLARYLGGAVRFEALRRRASRERDERIESRRLLSLDNAKDRAGLSSSLPASGRRRKDGLAPYAAPALITSDEGPDLEADRRLEGLLARVKLSPRQSELVDLMLRERLEPAAARRRLGYGWHVWQGFQRKARRLLVG